MSRLSDTDLESIDEMAETIAEMAQGGERGRKLLLKFFFTMMFDKGDPAGGGKFLQMVLPHMPREDREHVLFVINEVTSAMAYEE